VKLSKDELHRLARLGAVTRMETLHREIESLSKAFPEMFPRKGKRSMSAAARKNLSKRMKQLWAAKKRAK
jgi:alkylhydroperoxidase/carboxymuconolactone decarboxylase family protein YurZ